MNLVGAVAQHEHHALLAQAACEEGHEGPGRAVGPMHVLEDQRQRLALTQQIEQFDQGLE